MRLAEDFLEIHHDVSPEAKVAVKPSSEVKVILVARRFEWKTEQEHQRAKAKKYQKRRARGSGTQLLPTDIEK